MLPKHFQREKTSELFLPNRQLYSLATDERVLSLSLSLRQMSLISLKWEDLSEKRNNHYKVFPCTSIKRSRVSMSANQMETRNVLHVVSMPSVQNHWCTCIFFNRRNVLHLRYNGTRTVISCTSCIHRK